MPISPTPAPVPCRGGLDLSRHAQGLLSAAELSSFRGHVSTCVTCREGLSGVGPSVTRQRRWALLGSVALVACALGLSWHFHRRAEAAVAPGAPFSFWVAAAREGKPFRVEESTALDTGDNLAFFYSAARDGHLAIVYLEERGPPTWLFPANGESSAPVHANENHPLADGAVLTEPSGCEWLLALYSEAPVSRDQVLSAAAQAREGRRGCALSLPSAFQLSTPAVHGAWRPVPRAAP